MKKIRHWCVVIAGGFFLCGFDAPADSTLTNDVFGERDTLPQNYMMEKHGIAEPFYCDLEDPIEEIACMAWDAALGRHRANYNKIEFEVSLVMSAVGIIQTIASSPRNGLYVKHMGAISPFNIEQSNLCVIQKHGICGNHQDLLRRVLEFVDIPSRYIGIYYTTERFGRLNHAASEVYIGDHWRYFDVTWSTIWLSEPGDLTSLVSIQDLVRQPNKYTRLSNELDIWFQYQYAEDINPFGYLDPTGHLAVIKDQEGTLNFDPNEGFQHIPNYVGTNDGKNTGVTMRWTVPDRGQTLNLRLDVAGVGGCSSGGPIILDDAGNEYPLSVGTNLVTVPNGGSFNVKREQEEICYIVFNGIAVLN